MKSKKYSLAEILDYVNGSPWVCSCLSLVLRFVASVGVKSDMWIEKSAG